MCHFNRSTIKTWQSVRAHCNPLKEKKQIALATNKQQGRSRSHNKNLGEMQNGANLRLFMKTPISTKEPTVREMRLQTCMLRTTCVQSTTMFNTCCRFKPPGELVWTSAAAECRTIEQGSRLGLGQRDVLGSHKYLLFEIKYGQTKNNKFNETKINFLIGWRQFYQVESRLRVINFLTLNVEPKEDVSVTVGLVKVINTSIAT